MHLSDQDGSLSAGGLQDSAAGSGLAQTLQQEFSLVNLQIRNVNVEVSWRPMIETFQRRASSPPEFGFNV